MIRCKRTCRELTLAVLISSAILVALVPILGLVMLLASAPDSDRESVKPVISQMVDVIKGWS